MASGTLCKMSAFSFLDPQLETSFITDFIPEIECLIERKSKDLELKYKKIFEGKLSDDEKSWYGDMAGDEGFMLRQLEKTLLTGLAITASAILERHISLFVRNLSNKFDSISYSPTKTYQISELQTMLKLTNHPNRNKIDATLWQNLTNYKKIRNYLIHHEGNIFDDDPMIISFVSKSSDLFEYNSDLTSFSIKKQYTLNLLEDINKLFQNLLYLDKNTTYMGL